MILPFSHTVGSSDHQISRSLLIFLVRLVAYSKVAQHRSEGELGEGGRGEQGKTKPGAEVSFSGGAGRWIPTKIRNSVLACKKCFIIPFFNTHFTSTLTAYPLNTIPKTCNTMSSIPG